MTEKVLTDMRALSAALVVSGPLNTLIRPHSRCLRLARRHSCPLRTATASRAAEDVEVAQSRVCKAPRVRWLAGPPSTDVMLARALADYDELDGLNVPVPGGYQVPDARCCARTMRQNPLQRPILKR